MLNRWLELYDDIRAVNQEIRAQEGANAKTIILTGGAHFRSNVVKFAAYFSKFHSTHVAMEYRGLKLSDCREQLDSWVIMLQADLPLDHDLFRCELEMKYISDNADIIVNLDFERGIVKIQCRETGSLTDAEKVAVSGLLRNAPAAAAAAAAGPAAAGPGLMDDPDPAMLSSPRSLAKEMDRKRRREQAMAGHDVYINCDYIMGSVAEVERLWSLVRHILTYDRMSTKPMNVEALLFLKVNKRFWDEALVQEAMDALTRG